VRQPARIAKSEVERDAGGERDKGDAGGWVNGDDGGGRKVNGDDGGGGLMVTVAENLI
jgi:hypothetical protein